MHLTSLVAKDGLSWAGIAYIQYSCDFKSAFRTVRVQPAEELTGHTGTLDRDTLLDVCRSRDSSKGMDNHSHGPAEHGLDLLCETALQAPFIQHAKHQTWGMLLLSWERSLSVLILCLLLQSLAGNPEVFPFRSFFCILEMIFTHSFPYIELAP